MGWIVYRPETDGAHAFDMLCVRNKQEAIVVEVKAKARLNRWPATGIAERHYQDYVRFSRRHSMPIFILFVDEGEKRAYGNFIHVLDRPLLVGGITYPRLMNDWRPPTRLWPLAAMEHVADLDDAQCAELMEVSQRSHAYEFNAGVA